MFSMIFGSKKKSSAEDESGNSPPPVPGPRADDEFVILNPSPAQGQGSLYPNFSSGGAYPSVPAGSPYPGASPGYPKRPAPPPPSSLGLANDSSPHYLQGVPFALSKQLELVSNSQAFEVEIVDLLSFATRKLNIESISYNFSTERSVLHECATSIS